MTRISVDVVGEISEVQIEHLRALLTRQLDQMGLRGQVTIPPRFVLQRVEAPGDLTVKIHLSTDPIDREDSCRLLRESDESWVFTPAEVLDMMANPKRVFPTVCGRCMDRPGGIVVRKVLASHQPELWPEDAQRQQIVQELRDQFRARGWC